MSSAQTGPSFLRRRVLKKLRALLIVTAFGFLLMGAFLVLFQLVRPFLPEEILTRLDLLRNTGWRESKFLIRDRFLSLGPRGPVFFIAFQVLQVLIAPIPGQIAGLIGGFVFGFGRGLLYTMTGLAAGSILAMLIGRLLGKKVVRRLVSPSILERFDRVIAEGGLFSFFMIFLLPAMPDDAVCFLAGLTRLRLAALWGVCLLGRLPGMAVLSFAGAGLVTGSIAGFFVFGAAMLLALTIWLLKEEIEGFAKKFLRNEPPSAE